MEAAFVVDLKLGDVDYVLQVPAINNWLSIQLS